MSPLQGATWRNGYAPLCKSVYPGSIPGVASIHLFSYSASVPQKRPAAGRYPLANLERHRRVDGSREKIAPVCMETGAASYRVTSCSV